MVVSISSIGTVVVLKKKTTQIDYQYWVKCQGQTTKISKNIICSISWEAFDSKQTWDSWFSCRVYDPYSFSSHKIKGQVEV